MNTELAEKVVRLIHVAGGTKIKIWELPSGVLFRGFVNPVLYARMNIESDKFLALEKRIRDLGCDVHTVIFPHQENESTWQVNFTVSESDNSVEVVPDPSGLKGVFKVVPKRLALGDYLKDEPVSNLLGEPLVNLYDKFSPHQAGCFADSSSGRYIGVVVIGMATDRGWNQDGAKTAVPGEEDYEDMWDEAENYLQQFAPEGFAFGMSESGDWGLWAVEDENP